MEIKGEKIILVPIRSQEKDLFFDMATRSYGSQFWYDDARKKERSKEAFFNDWHEGYFDESKPEMGQCFWIQRENKNIGMVNYNAIDTKKKEVELDILIADKENIGKGYGPDAIRALVKYLFENFDINSIWIEARIHNQRAIKAYEKVGFKKEKVLPKKDYFNGEFVDCVRFRIPRNQM